MGHSRQAHEFSLKSSKEDEERKRGKLAALDKSLGIALTGQDTTSEKEVMCDVLTDREKQGGERRREEASTPLFSSLQESQSRLVNALEGEEFEVVVLVKPGALEVLQWELGSSTQG